MWCGWCYHVNGRRVKRFLAGRAVYTYARCIKWVYTQVFKVHTY
jgi:hypothetical protein